ncbi:MAG: hypothetical protein ACR2PK_06950 [Acidimicrobiales bacterium]
MSLNRWPLASSAGHLLLQKHATTWPGLRAARGGMIVAVDPFYLAAISTTVFLHD